MVQSSMQPMKLMALSVALYCAGALAQTQAAPTCQQAVYLTFDTGHMGVAPLIAQVLQRQQVKVTFFVAQEKTQQGDGSLGTTWAPWWAARAQEGHEFASHTFDHVYWQSNLLAHQPGHEPGSVPGLAPDNAPSFKMRPSAGAQMGQTLKWSAQDYCTSLKQASTRIETLTGRASLPLFRAPGGKTSPLLLAAAKSCGYAHVGWAPAGFLGDELPSEKFSNAQLLAQAVDKIRAGDVLMAHLGIWSRRDPWAPTVLEPLIVQLKSQGFCFATLRDHPDYRRWIAQHPRS
jgi:peptidoglycan/xylan/chitin deacetylase (PgdA/CDA1 family)